MISHNSYGFFTYVPQNGNGFGKREKFEYTVVICFSLAMEEKTCDWLVM